MCCYLVMVCLKICVIVGFVKKDGKGEVLKIIIICLWICLGCYENEVMVGLLLDFVINFWLKILWFGMMCGWMMFLYLERFLDGLSG